MVERSGKSYILENDVSVSEAILLRLGRDDLPQRTVLADAEQPQSAASKTRAKKRAEQGPQDYDLQKWGHRYISLLRIARASYVKMTDDYYGSQTGVGMWDFPTNIEHFDEYHCFVLHDTISSVP